MNIIDLGLISYQDADKIQQEAVQKLFDGGKQSLFILEHFPVISFGRNGGEENLPMSKDFYEKKGISIVKSTRGGNITCHFPGQLVAYPIMRVNKQPGGLRSFFYNMEESVIKTLEHFKVKSYRADNRPGVWIGDKKICSTGIAVKHWITSHGLALNIGRDIRLFEMVNPCGLPGVKATSLHLELGKEDIGMQEVKKVFVEKFMQCFKTPAKEIRETQK